MNDLFCRLLRRFFAEFDAKRPQPCLPVPRRLMKLVPITVAVGDWGSALDDVFQVWFDGELLLDPPAPVRSVSTTFAAYAGSHEVNVIGKIVPDGVGTYEVVFSNNVTVLSGPPLKGSNLGQAVQFTYHILLS